MERYGEIWRDMERNGEKRGRQAETKNRNFPTHNRIKSGQLWLTKCRDLPLEQNTFIDDHQKKRIEARKYGKTVLRKRTLMNALDVPLQVRRVFELLLASFVLAWVWSISSVSAQVSS